jgi:predicted phosphodiesterase
MKKENSKIITDYLDRFPNLPNMTLAKKIYNENKLQFNTLDTVRTAIRKLKGASGKQHLKSLGNDKYLPENKKIEKYNLPESIKQIYEPYNIYGNKILIFADLQIPFQDNNAISLMFDYAVDKDIDTIIIAGDLMDCFSVSYFNKEPDKIRFIKEKELTKQFLRELKRIFPKAKIYYKFGNHEKHYELYMMSKASEIFENPEFKLNVLLDLYNIGINYIEEDRYIIVNGELKVIHMHEYKNGITSPANPARTTFLRTKSNTISAHHHQTGQHSESKINGEIISCWSLGCLCGLNPKWMPLNKWNHGFAIYTKEDNNFWHVKNYMIIQGHVV